VVTAGGDLLPSQVAFDDQVLDALRDLAETARACLLMKTVMELDYKHIARVLGIAEGTAMSHVHRARSRMRAALSAEGLDAGRVAS
jgi:RNA polymerase sigma-70 factor (ECF subfamily)